MHSLLYSENLHINVCNASTTFSREYSPHISNYYFGMIEHATYGDSIRLVRYV